MLFLILLIVLILAVFPSWPYSRAGVTIHRRLGNDPIGRGCAHAAGRRANIAGGLPSRKATPRWRTRALRVVFYVIEE